jgi:hypothetical protein
MQIPLSYADAIIGSAGANISYMRRTSGATITIQETRSVPGEMTVEIHGSASQVQTAQQLIQVRCSLWVGDANMYIYAYVLKRIYLDLAVTFVLQALSLSLILRGFTCIVRILRIE